MKITPRFAVITLVFFYLFSPLFAQETRPIEPKLEEIKAKFAPDSRLELFDVLLDNANVFVETTSENAKEAVLALAQEYPNYEIKAALYPQENQELDGKWRALVNYSTIQIQKKPDFTSEWSTQALMGAPVRILKKSSGYWIMIQNSDGYIGYTTSGSVSPMTEAEFAQWRESKRLIWLENTGVVYAEPSLGAQTISDLVAGNVLVWKNEETQNGFRRVETPDGRQGWISEQGSQEWREWLASRELTGDNLVASARRLIGRPYVWGGTSTKGVDCSGMVNGAFMANGYNILRDVSQIRREGIDVDISQGWKNFQPGDLLIFGERRANGVTFWRHVGIYIADGRFIHSASLVHESSLDPESPDYDPGNARQLIKVVRMIGAPETEYFHPISKNKFFEM